MYTLVKDQIYHFTNRAGKDYSGDLQFIEYRKVDDWVFIYFKRDWYWPLYYIPKGTYNIIFVDFGWYFTTDD
jgi:hypothetical protein